MNTRVVSLARSSRKPRFCAVVQDLWSKPYTNAGHGIHPSSIIHHTPRCQLTWKKPNESPQHHVHPATSDRQFRPKEKTCFEYRRFQIKGRKERQRQSEPMRALRIILYFPVPVASRAVYKKSKHPRNKIVERTKKSRHQGVYEPSTRK
jgi:hypothetical protein